ncbi:MAG: hypothetical protein K8S94_16705 [Planctomycetia bacterium]|nr:hypothetical protein [Planctomycetia bacterium]
MRTRRGESDGGEPAARLGGSVEWLLILFVFAASGAWPVPDLNETVYLTKARHAADPTWAQGDFFLETPDAHGVFYLLMGPIAAAMPLEQTAWIGRIIGWASLALGFRHAIVPLLCSSWARVVAAAVFALALRNTTAAGEWVIGGCEAKVDAWAFVLGGLGEVARGRFAWAVCLCGAATAFHPIVGGWALVATAASWLATGRPAASEGRGLAAVLVIMGLLLAGAGVVPALGLTAGVGAEVRAEATRIYVVERLSHHLLPRTFADGMLARHVLAIAAWWLLHRLVPASAARGRIAAFTLAAIGLSLTGCVIAVAEPWAPAAVYGLLRYYWFRLGDVAVPFALATTVAALLEDEMLCSRVVGVRPVLVRGFAVAVLLLDLAVQSLHWPLPGRTGLAPRSDSKVAAAAWAEICDWTRDHTPANACFLTPRATTSFTWRTGRREVVSWKNSPQDAASLIEWRRRIVDCFSRNGSLVEMERSTASLGADRLQTVASRYGADHAIVPLDAPLVDAIRGERLHANGVYAVYRLTQP